MEQAIIFADYATEMEKVAKAQAEYQSLARQAETNLKSVVAKLLDIGVQETVWGSVTFGIGSKIYKIGWMGDKRLLVYVSREPGIAWGDQSVVNYVNVASPEFQIAIAAVLPNLLWNIALVIEAKVSKIKKVVSELDSRRANTLSLALSAAEQPNPVVSSYRVGNSTGEIDDEAETAPSNAENGCW
jgi:hypothetical protein